MDENSEGLSNKFLEYFDVPEKRNVLGLFEVHNKILSGPKVAFKCKSIVALQKWCFKVDKVLRESDKF